MTREDVLREFASANTHNEFDGFRVFDMADEIVRLRARLHAVREGIRVEHDDARIEWVTAQLDRDVLAALEDTP